jgi:hypothetical protein
MTLLLTLSGIVLYGGSWVALNTFYQSLGTSVDDVGVSYLSIVATAAISLVRSALFYVFSAALLVGLMYGLTSFLVWVFKWARRNKFTYLDYLREQKIKPAQLRIMTTLGTALVLAYLLYRWLNIAPPQIPEWSAVAIGWTFVLAPIAFAFTYALAITRPVRGAQSPPSDIVDDLLSALRGLPRAVIGLLPLVLVGTTILGADEQGEKYAAQVMAGQEVQSAKHAAVPFQASCVTLLSVDNASTTLPKTQLTTAQTPLEGHKLLYLGQSGGIAVLYQVNVGAIRVPTNRFVIRAASAPCRD